MHAHVGLHYFGRQRTVRFGFSHSMSAFLSGLRSGLLNPVVYHAPPSTGYAGYGMHAAPDVGHYAHTHGYWVHPAYATGYPPAYTVGYPAVRPRLDPA
jgi:hypothetical protein